MAHPRFPRTVDDVTVRVIAGEVLVVTVLALVTRQPWLYGVLAVDFLLRTVFGPALSPFARLAATTIRPRLKASPQPTPGPPKRFAAGIGAFMTVAATLTYYVAGWTTLTWLIGAVMVVFPLLEAGFGICAGCIAFSGLMRIGVIPRSICEECADIRLRLTSAQRARLAVVDAIPVADGVVSSPQPSPQQAQPAKTRSR
ncbi:DUF4395 domain-containing protein [Angustibacter sp. McL0619]|uniref:DUF4395 domain-containing protein n=1 Tax=Angustibacter sp. McL0619 TaxID=3415676 RepID=UPI003CE6A160